MNQRPYFLNFFLLPFSAHSCFVFLYFIDYSILSQIDIDTLKLFAIAYDIDISLMIQYISNNLNNTLPPWD